MIRGALATLDLRERIAREIEGLLMYLDACAGDTGCQAYVRTLCTKIGLTRRTLHRRLATAREHHLLRSQRARPGGPCINVVDWQKVRALAYGGEKAPEQRTSVAARPAQAGTVDCDSSQRGNRPIAAAKLGPQTGTRLRQTGTRSCQIGTTSNQYKAIQTTTPSNLPLAVTSAGERGQVDPWAEAQAAVVAAGVLDWRRAIREAKARELSPADALAIVAYWRGRMATSGWTNPPGMLCYLLRTMDVAQLPPVVARAATAQPRAQPQREPAAAPARCEALERLSPEALADLAQRVFAEHTSLRMTYARYGLASETCYEFLAAAIAAEETLDHEQHRNDPR